jgi:hypothetical protein
MKVQRTENSRPMEILMWIFRFLHGELANFIKLANIDFSALPESDFDRPLENLQVLRLFLELQVE